MSKLNNHIFIFCTTRVEEISTCLTTKPIVPWSHRVAMHCPISATQNQGKFLYLPIRPLTEKKTVAQDSRYVGRHISKTKCISPDKPGKWCPQAVWTAAVGVLPWWTDARSWKEELPLCLFWCTAIASSGKRHTNTHAERKKKQEQPVSSESLCHASVSPQSAKGVTKNSFLVSNM